MHFRQRAGNLRNLDSTKSTEGAIILEARSGVWYFDRGNLPWPSLYLEIYLAQAGTFAVPSSPSSESPFLSVAHSL